MNIFTKIGTAHYILIAIVAVLFAFFVVLPLLPQVDSPLDMVTLKASVASAIGGDAGGDGAGGGSGSGGGDGNGPGDGAGEPGAGCCGDSDSGGEPGGGDADTGDTDDARADRTPDVTPTPTPTPAPTCTLSASPDTIEKGDKTTLSWTTENARRVFLDNGIGQVSKNSSRGQLTPEKTTTYTLTAEGDGGTVTCTEKVKVNEPDPAPTCAITLNKTDLTLGDKVRISFEATDNDLVRVTRHKVVNNDLTELAVLKETGASSGSVVDTPASEGTFAYRVVAKGPGGDEVCADRVEVKKPVPGAPVCTLSPKTQTIESGETTTLNFTTKNTDTLTLQTNNSTPLDLDALPAGVIEKTLTSDATLTLVARNNETGKTDVCTAEIKIAEPTPTPDAPTCTLSASPDTINKGDKTTLTWTTENARKVFINQGIGQVSKNSSRGQLTPEQTTTYTLTAEGDGGTVTCTEKVVVKTVVPTPTCTLSPDVQTITSGQTAFLDFTTENADVLTLQTNNSTPLDLDALPAGVIEKTLTSDATLTLVARNNTTGKEATCVAKIFVQQEDAPTCTLSLNRTDITVGDQVRASFDTTKSDRVLVTRHFLGPNGLEDRTELEETTAASGSVVDTPPSKGTFVYRAIAKGPGGDAVCADRVVVNKPVVPDPTPDAPTCIFSASPDTIKKGDKTTLSWTTENAREVSIDQGIGEVSKNSSRGRISPSQTTVYTLTAKGDGGTTTCTEKIKVTTATPEPSAPTCTLEATPESITKGGKSTLVWTTENAREVFINQGIGQVSKNSSRGRLSPTETTVYTLTAKGDGGTVKCDAKIKVVTEPTPTPDDAPTCTLEATPDTINKGGKTTLSWTTENAREVSIDQGIGEVSKNSSRGRLTPDKTTTYTLTAKGDGGVVTCTEKVVVKTPTPTPDVPTCTFEATPDSIEKGGKTTLSWTTENARKVFIDNGIGQVSKNSSRGRISPSQTTVYTLTAEGDGGTTTCTTKVKVTKTPTPTPDAPTCTLSASPDTINKGDKTTLTWTTENARKVFINQGIGQVSKNSSRGQLTPEQTTTYTLTAEGDGGTVTCTEKVVVKTVVPTPTCTLSPDVQTITSGQTAFLDFTTENADVLTLQTNNSTPLDLDALPAGVIEKTLTSDATLTLVARNNTTGKEATCVAKIFVQQEDAPTCTLSLNRTDITVGDQVRASFDTTKSDRVLVTRHFLGPNGLEDRTELEETTAASGSVVDTPPSKGTFVYRAIAKGPGGDAVCADRVVVNKPVVPDPLTCDAFSASPDNLPVGGGKTTLTWETSNATDVTIDNGVGTVSGDGTEEVTVTDDTTFTLTATRGSESVTCDTTVTVEDDTQEPMPICDAFSASPDNLPVGGGKTTLTWETTDATSVSIDNGVGDVDLDGDTEIDITDDTTFTLTATRGNDSITCDTTVTVEDDTQEPTVSCDAFSASPNSFSSGGGETTLSWETTDATDVSISGVGDVAVDGSVKVDVNNDTNFVLTATDSEGNKDTCSVDVSVDSGGGGGGGSSSPRCDLFEVSRTLSNGDIVLHWETRRGFDMRIEPNLLETTDNDYIEDGYATVTPQTNVRYTLVVERGSRDDTCTLDTGPGITVITDRDQQPVTSISLTQIPYTGFDAGPFLAGLFYSVLVLWSLGIAYVLVIRRGTVFGFAIAPKHATVVETEKCVLPREEYYHRSVAMQQEDVATHIPETRETVPANLPTGDTESCGIVGYQSYQSAPAAVVDTEENDTYLENHAHAKQVLLSSDAIRMIEDAERDMREQTVLLDEIIERAKESYPREDGWLIINRERINDLFADVHRSEAGVAAVAEGMPAIPVMQPAETSVHSLAEAIVSGDVAAAYQRLGSEPMLALAEAASELDQVYRARRGEHVAAHDMLVRATSHVADTQLESAIGALVSAIDGTYADEAAAVKLAIVKAVKATI